VNRAIGLSSIGIIIFMLLLVSVQGTGPRAQEVLAGSLLNRVVVIDPGHGGPDGGCSGPGGTLEKEIVLLVGLQLQDFFRQAGFNVVMTRTDDSDLSGLDSGSLRTRKKLDLVARAELINASGADVALSIHANAITSSRWYGAQTFYSSGNRWAEQNERLATTIQAELRRLTGNTSRVASDRIAQYILDNADLPAVNVEIGFLSNPREEQLLRSEAYRRRVAWAIFVGTARYLVEGVTPASTASPGVPVCFPVWAAVHRAGTLSTLQTNPLVSLVPELMCSITPH